MLVKRRGDDLEHFFDTDNLGDMLGVYEVRQEACSGGERVERRTLCMWLVGGVEGGRKMVVVCI